MMLYSTKTFLAVLICFFFQVGSESLICGPASKSGLSESRAELQYGKPGAPEGRLRVVPKMARIRQLPSVESIALGLAPGGLLVQPLEKTGDWYRVSLPDRKGVEGWIRADLLEPIALPSLLRPEEQASSLTAKVAPVPTPVETEVTAAGTVGKTNSLQTYQHEGLSLKDTAVGYDVSYLLSLFLGWTLFVSFSALGIAVFLPPDA